MHVQPWVPAQKGGYVITLVDRAAVPQEIYRTAQMPKQMPEEHHDLGPRDVVRMDVHVQADPGTLRGHRHR